MVHVRHGKFSVVITLLIFKIVLKSINFCCLKYRNFHCDIYMFLEKSIIKFFFSTNACKTKTEENSAKD